MRPGFYTVIILLVIIVSFNVAVLFKIWLNAQSLEINNLDVVKFNDYLVKFNKSYAGLEYNRRLENFKASLAEIARLNALEGDTVFGLTKFSDMSDREFAEQNGLSGYWDAYKDYEGDGSLHEENTVSSTKRNWHEMPVPDEYDWRVKGYVSPVLDQKYCNACWAISIVGVMETMAAERGLAREPLSVQQLLDCSTYTNKCFNGSVSSGLAYIKYKTLGLSSEQLYPLTLKSNSPCHYFSGNTITLESYEYHDKKKEVKDEEDILRIIANHGPVTTILALEPLRHYLGGIIRRACVKPTTGMLHAAAIVGYKKNEYVPYYIVKNSWGSLYGENGYMKIAIYHNVCGIADAIGELDVKRRVYKQLSTLDADSEMKPAV